MQSKLEFSSQEGYIQCMSVAVYHPWLYDSKEAWQKTLSDARWAYDMPMSRFMSIYMEYRGIHGATPMMPSPMLHSVSASVPIAAPLSPAVVPASSAASATPSAGGVGQILSQNEIDSLLNQLAK